METHIETLWIFALISKCQPYSLFIILALTLSFWLSMTFIFWAHPGGPAWGKYYLFHKISNPFIPGPRGYPILGSINLMSKLPHQKIAQIFQSSSKRRRLMAFSFGESRVIVTCDPNVAKEILTSPVFSDRPIADESTAAYGLMFNRAMGFAPYGVYWRTLRRISATHLFSPKQIRATEIIRTDVVSKMVAMFKEKYCRGWEEVGTVRKVIKSASLNNMMSSVFGREYGLDSSNVEQLDELVSLVNEGYELLGTLNWADHFSWLREFDPQKIRFRCSKIVPRVNRFVSRIISEHRAREGSEMNQDFVDVLLSLQGSDKLSDFDMTAVLWEMIFRGTDTVAVLIEWILARMILHPDVQSKVHNELDKVVGRSRAVQESDISSMVYLPAVVKEVLRLHPPGPLLSWARLAITDTSICGYHVPGGTTAMVNIWAISRDPQVWVDPLEFNPDRFVTNECEVEFSVLGSDLRLAPFGSGRRTCPGKALGLTTVNFWVASLLHEFEWLSSDRNAVDLTEVLKLSCEMKNPLTAKVCPRRTSTM